MERMAEPPVTADHLQEVVPGVSHWRVANPNIGGATSSSHAVRSDSERTVLIDPVPLADEQLEKLEPVAAIVLTAACHQRAAWRYRRRFGASVYLPRGSRETDEEPDVHYSEGDVLPGELEAVHVPGPEEPHFALLRHKEPAVLFCPDLVMVENEQLVFVPGEYHEDPNETRKSVERLLELPFDVLCLDHGPPLLDDPKESLRQLLAVTRAW
jgi:glyoxylase-like metal-dependent hydrolase (beta-lactamase superfamily II)